MPVASCQFAATPTLWRNSGRWLSGGDEQSGAANISLRRGASCSSRHLQQINYWPPGRLLAASSILLLLLLTKRRSRRCLAPFVLRSGQRKRREGAYSKWAEGGQTGAQAAARRPGAGGESGAQSKKRDYHYCCCCCCMLREPVSWPKLQRVSSAAATSKQATSERAR